MTYRERQPEVVKAEMDYIQSEIDKTMDTLKRLENRKQYLQNELNFNLEKINK